MTSKSKSKGLSAGAMIALGLVAATLISGTASAGHKHHGQPKGPQNPGPIGPLPKPPGPQVDTQWPATKPPPVVRDHRPAPMVRDHRPAPVVRDQRKVPVVAASRTNGGSGGVTVTGNTARPRGKSSTSGKACIGSVCVTHPKIGTAIDRNTPR